MGDTIENDILELFIKYDMPLSSNEIIMSLFGNFNKHNFHNRLTLFSPQIIS